MKLDGNKVHWHRDRLGLTLDKLAEEAGVAKGTLLRAEHGEDLQPRSGHRIARAFGVDISELIPEKPGRVKELAGAGKAEAPREAGPPARKKPVVDLVREAIAKQDEQDWQAIARAAESERMQVSHGRHEKEAMLQLLERRPDDLAEACFDLAKHNREMEREIARLREELERVRELAGSNDS